VQVSLYIIIWCKSLNVEKVGISNIISRRSAAKCAAAKCERRRQTGVYPDTSERSRHIYQNSASFNLPAEFLY